MGLKGYPSRVTLQLGLQGLPFKGGYKGNPSRLHLRAPIGQPFKMLPGQMLLKITVKVLFWLVQLLQDCGTTTHLLLLR